MLHVFGVKEDFVTSNSIIATDLVTQCRKWIQRRAGRRLGRGRQCRCRENQAVSEEEAEKGKVQRLDSFRNGYVFELLSWS